MNNELINRETLKEEIRESEFTTTLGQGFLFTEQVIKIINNAQTVSERDYNQGWHDAITKALNEVYTISTEYGSFKVVQAETLEGLGMSIPDKEEDNENLNQDTV